MYSKFLFLPIGLIISIVLVFVYKDFQNRKEIETDKRILIELVNILDYEVNESNFSHEYAPWYSVESNHDSMYVLLETNDNSEKVNNRIINAKMDFSIPKTIYGNSYANYWFITYKGAHIIATLQSTPGIIEINTPFTTDESRYINFYFDRKSRE